MNQNISDVYNFQNSCNPFGINSSMFYPQGCNYSLGAQLGTTFANLGSGILGACLSGALNNDSTTGGSQSAAATVEEIEAAMKGMLEPVFEEKIVGEAEVRQLFKFSKVGTIAGCYVADGVIERDNKARIIRDGIVIYDGNINTIAREKDQVKEVKSGIECGITIENFNDIKEQDVIEAYEVVEIER